MAKHYTFQRKIYVSYTLLISFILIICGFFFYKYNANILSDNLKNSTFSSLDLLDARMNSIFLDLSDSLKSIQISNNFLDIVKPVNETQRNYFSQYPSIASSLKAIFQYTILSKSYKSSIYYLSKYYDNIGIAYNTSVPYQEKNVLKQRNDLSDLLNMDEYIAYLPPHKDNWVNSDHQVISIVRPVRSTFITYGILEYTIEVSEFENLLSHFESPQDYHLLIIDEKGSLAYASKTLNNPEEVIKSYAEQKTDAEIGTFYSNQAQLCAYKTSATTGWTIILSRDVSSFINKLHQLALLTVFAALLVLIVVAVFIYVLTQYLTAPLRSLYHQLSTCELSPDIKMHIETESDEIISLTNAIQEILRQIYLQNNKLLEARKRTLRAHYDAMEAQLNPHFLYNTLSVIGACGLKEGNLTVTKMCSELATLLRYSISYSGKAVQLKNEINNIKSYLYIMQMRYEDDLQLTWDLDRSIDSISVPKLVLQPLIENCFQHGFNEAPPPWKIKIKSYHTDTHWFISICNNGSPFPKDKEEQIYDKFDKFKHSFFENSDSIEFLEKQGFGLENTIMRLHIFYNGKESFSIHSNPDKTILEIGSELNGH